MPRYCQRALRNRCNTYHSHPVYSFTRLQWIQHKAKEDNLQKFTESTEVHIINPPQTAANNSHKPLLVLDLDHTLLDFSSRTLTENGATALDIGSSGDTVANQLKRPYMDEFLTWSYKYYNLVVWSQTSWRWLEVRSLCIFAIEESQRKFPPPLILIFAHRSS